MGRRKVFVDQDLTFKPEISDTSKRLARRFRQDENSECSSVPHFMRETLSRSVSQNPELLAIIKPKRLRETMIVESGKPLNLSTNTATPVQVQHSSKVDGVSAIEKIMKKKDSYINFPSSDNSNTHPMSASSQTKAHFEQFNHDPSAFMSSGPRPPGLDKSTFTFKPKMSATSAKIAEQLNTNFMMRQQRHLEKQKQFIEQAGFQLRSISPAFLEKKSKAKSAEKACEVKCEMFHATVRPESVPGPIEGAGREDQGQQDGSSSTEPPPTCPSSEELPSVTKSCSAGSLSVSEPARIKHLLSPSKTSLSLKRSNSKLRRHHSIPPETQHIASQSLDTEDGMNPIDSSPAHIGHSRSRTMPPQLSPGRGSFNRKLSSLNLERIKVAKEQADKAIKNKKLFVIQGPYPKIREALRKRGWVERFLKMQPPSKKSPRKKKKTAAGEDSQNNANNSDDDDSDDDDDDLNDIDMGYTESSVPPWEEDNGIYGIMSRVVRNCPPSFIWSLRRDVVDFRYLRKEQIVNHYARAGSFTTKVGLCVNMRNVPWFDESDPDTFFPRCYRLSHDEEKLAFIDDYRLTTCINLLKWVQERQQEPSSSSSDSDDSSSTGDEGQPNAAQPTPAQALLVCTNPECTRSRPNGSGVANKCVHLGPRPAISPRKSCSVLPPIAECSDSSPDPVCPACKAPMIIRRPPPKKGGRVPPMAVDLALKQCEKFILQENHQDIDQLEDDNKMPDSQWDQLIQWYYQVVHEGATITHIHDRLEEINNMLNRVKTKWPQFELDGLKNVWIVKPGAKSRGRGITCYDRLEDMLRLVSSTVVKKEGKYVVQKYIERPLLIYNTKFDIRQWFLVTDWNPFTLWFYKDSYLRFCSQQYTLDNFNEAIHLSNNAIQKNYENGPRADELPRENMWSSEQFKVFLKERGFGHLWEEQIYPGMKKAVTCALLSAQDIIEYRKSAFELYGADFMLTEDYQPWLIEINCAPSMSYSTKVTSRLCANVLEDTIKVVIDRKTDKNCDTGQFELAYKQAYVTVPPYIGIDLTVCGQSVKKPGFMVRRQSEQTAPVPIVGNKMESEVVYKRAQTHVQSAEKTEKSTSAPAKIGGSGGSSSCTEVIKQSLPASAAPSSTAAITVSRLPTSSHISLPKPPAEKPSNSRPRPLPPPPPPTKAKPQNASHSVHQLNRQAERLLGRQATGNCQGDKLLGRRDPSVAHSKDKSLPRREATPKFHTSTDNTTDLAQKQSLLSKPVCSTSLIHQSVTHMEASNATPSCEKIQLPSRNGELSNPDAIEDSPQKGYTASLTDGSTWSKTCSNCGNGMNLKLDLSNSIPCKCQQDSVLMDFGGQRARSARGRSHSTTPRSRPSTPVSRTPTPQLSLGSSDTLKLNLQRLHASRNKLVATVYSKTCGQDPNKSKYVLKYTDGGIKRPKTPKHVFAKGFPKLVTRYTSKKPQKDDIWMAIDSYKGQQQKLSVVSHVFDI